MHIAYLSCQVTQPGSPNRRSDAFEHDHMMAALSGPMLARGFQLQDIPWDDPDTDWSQFAAAIIGTTWDYWDRAGEYLATLARIEAQTRLFNPHALVVWNSSKTYLRDLEARGAPLIPTVWLDKVSSEKAAGAFAALSSRDLIFKRQIGAGAHGQYRLALGDPLPPMPHAMLVQPFMPAITTEGEFSFIFIDGQFSHALIKRAQPGDYRIQSSYGGYETRIDPEPADLRAAQDVLALLDEAPLYARVDMVRGGSNTTGKSGLLLMELELIEPYLYPLQGPELGEQLASALIKRL